MREVAVLRERLGPGNYGRIARKAGYARKHVGRALQGLDGLSFTSACKIADAARVSLDELRLYIGIAQAERLAPVAMKKLTSKSTKRLNAELAQPVEVAQ